MLMIYRELSDKFNDDKILSDTVGVTDIANIVNFPCHYTALPNSRTEECVYLTLMLLVKLRHMRGHMSTQTRHAH